MPPSALHRIRTTAKWTLLILGLLALAGCSLPTATPFALPTSTLAPQTDTPTLEPGTSAPAATDTPTLPPPTDTLVPTIANPVVVRDTLCYLGPGKVYGVVSSLLQGTTVPLLGKSAQLDWWIVQNPRHNVPCWIAASDLQIDLSIDTSSLEVVTPPPYPANLVAGALSLDPSPPNCMDQFNVILVVKNTGSEATITKGTVSATDYRDSDGKKQASATGSFPTLDPGASATVTIPMTVSNYWGEKHNIKVVVDPDQQIPESNEGDNSKSISYTLAQGSCP
jgi:hypothetical protein